MLVDIVVCSKTSVCKVGLASNAKFPAAKSLDDLNRPELTIAYYAGGREEGWVKERFPQAGLRGVAGLGVSRVEGLLANRADAVPINHGPRLAVGRKLEQLAVSPRKNNGQDSTEKPAPIASRCSTAAASSRRDARRRSSARRALPERESS